MPLPTPMVEDSHQVVTSGVVILFMIELLTGPVIRLKRDESVWFMGALFEGTEIVMTGVERSSDGKLPRPTLKLVNPSGLYSQYVRAGYLDYAKVTRYRINYDDLLRNNPVHGMDVWRIFQVQELTNDKVVFGLRSLMDRFNYTIPVRQFMPPDFPAVKLS